MEKFKSYFKYVNQWSLLFWGFVVLQVIFSVVRSHDIWETVWGIAILWGFYLCGYNSLDRELKIMLDKAREEMAKDA